MIETTDIWYLTPFIVNPISAIRILKSGGPGQTILFQISSQFLDSLITESGSKDRVLD